MGQATQLSELKANSLRISTETRLVRIDHHTNPETEQTYLVMQGTPNAYRWLATLLLEMADSAEKSVNGHSVIVRQDDLSRRPITLTDWSSLDLNCRQANVE